MTHRVASIEEVFPGGVRGTVATAVGAIALIFLTHVVVPHWSTRYGSYLVVFTIWMSWFVLAGVNFVGQE